MNKIWHVGFAAPDLDQAMSQLGELFELTWRPIVTRSMTIKDEGGHPFDVDCHVTFSLGGPFAVEVWQAIPDTPLATPQAGWLHHLGYWVEDYPAEGQRLDTLGFVPVLTSEPTLLLSRGPGNICVEPCDLGRDQPYLRDLYPVGSEFFGEPILPTRVEELS
jgi:catechol 2,3-dioxygenase-like lactoylglutathione lyase family enzyme